MAIFYFIEKDDYYLLTDSLGREYKARWKKSLCTFQEALEGSDRMVGLYIRENVPKECKYILQLKDNERSY